MSINLGQNKKNYIDLQFGALTDSTDIVVMSKNKTSGIVSRTNYERITPHDNCMMISIFATVQLLPNPEFISMVSTDQITLIPYKIVSYEKKPVVFCVSPVYVSEQWQNFLMAVHIFKQFGGHMHIYLVSAVTSFFELMQEYDKSGYVTIQPWSRMLFPYVPGSIVDAYSQVEFQNTAAAHTDCLLQYKEAADFVALFNLNDILIPKIAPTYVEEFHSLIGNRSDVVYLFYESINYQATVFNNTKFFIEDMISSLTEIDRGHHGKVVINTQKLNYTYMYRPVYLKDGSSLDVTDNFITHLKSIVWVGLRTNA
uniref:Glycosyltransferase family 92 protein n=1 Tax=Caenorhabditis tropicalis TaxID=1561998 RepID=A0A1I7T7K5_9PELO